MFFLIIDFIYYTKGGREIWLECNFRGCLKSMTPFSLHGDDDVDDDSNDVIRGSRIELIYTHCLSRKVTTSASVASLPL